MSHVKVTCEIKNYDTPAKESMRVHSDWIQREMVEIEIRGERFRVSGRDLITAVQNCMNTK